MIWWELFIGFLEVGCFSFGGAYAAIPLIRDVVLKYGWLEEETLLYFIGVCESTPGPIMINMATYIGSSQAGFPGALIATTAVVIPSFLVILLITMLMKTALQNKYAQAVLQGLKPCVTGIILATGIYMLLQNCIGSISSVRLNFRGVFIAALLYVAKFAYSRMTKKQLSPILLILISAIVGIAAFGA